MTDSSAKANCRIPPAGKAQNYEFNPDHRTAIGVVMRSNELRLCAINLYGNVIEKRNDALPYRNTNVYYQRIGGIINNFAADVEKKHGRCSASRSPSKASSPRRHHHHLRHHYGQHWAHAPKPSANRSITRA